MNTSYTFSDMVTADTSFEEQTVETNVFENRVVYKPEL